MGHKNKITKKRENAREVIRESILDRRECKTEKTKKDKREYTTECKTTPVHKIHESGPEIGSMGLISFRSG